MCDRNEVKLSSETMVVKGGHWQQKKENVLSTDSAGGRCLCLCVYKNIQNKFKECNEC